MVSIRGSKSRQEIGKLLNNHSQIIVKSTYILFSLIFQAFLIYVIQRIIVYFFTKVNIYPEQAIYKT